VLSDAVADRLDLPVLEAAHGVLMVAVATMTRAVKAVSTYRGRDPRDFALCAFGGNGPMVGAEIARALSMRHVLVPPAPGVFSAVGLLFSQTEQEFVRTLLLRAGEIEARAVEEAYDSLAGEARATLAEEGIAAQTVTLARLADLRYAGQAYELTIRVADGRIDLSRLTADFVAEHERTYGHGSMDDPVDLVSIRVVARVDRPALQSRLAAASDGAADGRRETRRAYFGPSAGLVDVPVIGRAALDGAVLEGPLFVDEYDSTTVIPPGCRATLDPFGSIDIDVD
jgi:N-methylhydantoinase A